MRIFRSIGSVLALALSACFFSAWSYAGEPTHYIYAVMADVGQYGAITAEFSAQLAASHERTSSSVAGVGLLKDGHGFVQESLSEVAKGKVGSNAPAITVI